MRKKVKYTFYKNNRKIASCVVNVSQRIAFDGIIGEMAAYSNFHDCNIQYQTTDITTE